MIHRALLGSIERFFGVLLEHYAGAFPPWLAPEQVCVIPVSEVFNSYSGEVFTALKQAGLRVYMDDGADRMNAKIRNAQNMKVPYMLVLGDREAQGNVVSVRYRDGRQVNGITVDEFIALVKEKVAKREAL
jgi:threonyl-tRNA synthetase